LYGDVIRVEYVQIRRASMHFIIAKDCYRHNLDEKSFENAQESLRIIDNTLTNIENTHPDYPLFVKQ
jgi:hypothetical protein